MTVSAVGGEQSLALAKAAADSEYFALLFKNQAARAEAFHSEQRAQEEKVAEKPIGVVLGGEFVELEREFASALMHAIATSLDEITANPDGLFKLPNGLSATGKEILAAHSAFILAGLT